MTAEVHSGRPAWAGTERLMQPREPWLASVTAQLTRADVAIAAALLAWVSFSLPGREGPQSASGIDLLALAKFGLRVAAVLYFGWQLVFGATGRAWRARQAALGSRRPITIVTLPWFAYVGWAVLSVAWSPLPTVSFGQWLGLLGLALFAETIAQRIAVHHYRAELAKNRRLAAWQREHESPQAEAIWHRYLSLLNLVLFIYCGGVLLTHLVAPNLSGLDRSISFDGGNGFVHPTAVGAASSLGVVIAAITAALGLTKRTRLLALCVLVHLVVLYLSASRSALLMTFISLAAVIALFRPNMVGWCSLLAGAAMLTVVVVDPGAEITSQLLGGATDYIRRGQTVEQLRAVSGRTEMWEAVLAEYHKSPILGHGYFVTSSTGRLDVWDRPANHDAHHLLLQAFVSTGAIGGLIFITALAATAIPVLRRVRLPAMGNAVRHRHDQLPKVLAVALLWYAGWSQGCVTFMGPTRPESIVFFVFLGLAAGDVDTRLMRFARGLGQESRA